MRVRIHYFVQRFASFRGTPFVVVPVEVSPSSTVGELKRLVCRAAQGCMIEEMMALMVPEKPVEEESVFFSARLGSKVGCGDSFMSMLDRRVVDEDSRVGDLRESDLALGIAAGWLRKCPV